MYRYMARKQAMHSTYADAFRYRPKVIRTAVKRPMTTQGPGTLARALTIRIRPHGLVLGVFGGEVVQSGGRRLGGERYYLGWSEGREEIIQR
jgi:hypothetical protein